MVCQKLDEHSCSLTTSHLWSDRTVPYIASTPNLHPTMTQRYTAFLACLSLSAAMAQECGTGRYFTANYFDAATVTSAVTYGSNTAVAGGTQILRMDVYEPTGDLLDVRPVVIVAFGGSFISGTRADVAAICQDLAKRGYVAIAPDYRVGFFFPNAATTTRAVMRGSHDMKAVVRYLRKSYSELGNPYRIDPERIISGGVSAGAISALHAVYLDQESEIPSAIAAEMPALGGVEGNSGSPGYSSEVFACYSFSGAIGDTSWIIAGDAPLASIHEVGDGVVPYYTQEVSVIGIPTGLIASGSHDIHQHAANIGLVNCFKSYPGTGHVGYLSTDFAVAMDWTAQFLGELSCGTAVSCGATTSIAGTQRPVAASAFPNPTNGNLQFELPEASIVKVIDASGRLVLSERFAQGTARMDLSSLPTGAYAAEVRNSAIETFRVVKVD